VTSLTTQSHSSHSSTHLTHLTHATHLTSMTANILRCALAVLISCLAPLLLPCGFKFHVLLPLLPKIHSAAACCHLLDPLLLHSSAPYPPPPTPPPPSSSLAGQSWLLGLGPGLFRSVTADDCCTPCGTTALHPAPCTLHTFYMLLDALQSASIMIPSCCSMLVP